MTYALVRILYSPRIVNWFQPTFVFNLVSLKCISCSLLDLKSGVIVNFPYLKSPAG